MRNLGDRKSCLIVHDIDLGKYVLAAATWNHAFKALTSILGKELLTLSSDKIVNSGAALCRLSGKAALPAGLRYQDCLCCCPLTMNLE